MDIAELGLAVKKDQVEAATGALGAFTTAAGKAEGAAKSLGATSESSLRASIARTASAIRDQQAAFRAGAIGQQEFVASIRTLQQQADGYRSALGKIPSALDQVDRAGVRAAGGLGHVRGTLAAMAADIAGVDPRLASLISQFGALGLGSLYVIGVLAAAAAIGFAYRKLTEEARRTEQAAKDAAKAVAEGLETLRSKVLLQAADIEAQASVLRTKVQGPVGLGYTGEQLRRDKESLQALDLALSRLNTTLGEVRGNDAIASLGRQLKELQHLASLGPLSEQNRLALANLQGAIGGARAGATAEQIQQLKDLATQAETLLHAQEKVAGLWTKISGGLIQQAMTDLERALANVPQFLQGVTKVAETVDALAGGPLPDILKGVNALTNFQTSANALIAAANQGGGTIVTGTQAGQTPDRSKQIAENWSSVAASVANTVTLLANADDATSRWLGNMVNLVGLIADANQELKEIGKLSTGSTIGLISGGLSFLAGALGGNEATRRANELAEKNHEATERLIRSLDNVSGGLTGNQFSAARGGVNTLLGAVRSNPIDFIKGIGLDTGAANAILRGQGTSLSELKDLAKDLGITLDTTNVIRFRDSLQELQKALQDMDLVRLKSFGSQLDLLNRQWAIAGTTDPFAKLADLIKLIQGEQGSPRLGKYLGSLDLSQTADRNAARDYLLREIERARNGQLRTEDLGGLTVQQYLDYLSQFGGLLNEANAQIQATIDNLRSFADSLKLDQSLTTLSPGQQLAESRRQYETVLAAAMGGDQAAANRLPEVARQFLSISRSYNASSPAYAADFARVLAQTEAVARLFEGVAAGWEILLKPIEVVEDNTRATVDRLDTMIELIVADAKQQEVQSDELAEKVDALIRATKTGMEGLKV